MWTGTWRHDCEDGSVTFVQSETKGHPLHGEGRPPHCGVCPREWVLKSWQGPVRNDRQEKKPRFRRGRFNAQQMELF